MHPEVLNLVQGNGLVLGCIIIWRLVALWVSSEGSKVDFASRDGSDWIDDDRHKWILTEVVISV